MTLTKDEENILEAHKQEERFQQTRRTREAVGKFECDYCDFITDEKRGMGLHTQHNHPKKMEEWLRIYDDNISEDNQNKIEGVKK